MLREDFVIQTNVRRILIRSNIDYSEINFGTVKGVVYIQGTFKVSSGAYIGGEEDLEGFMGKTLRSLELKIRGIPGVVDVNFQLGNWKKDMGKWSRAKPQE